MKGNLDEEFMTKNSFAYIQEIGQGAFGSVHLVFSLQYNQNFAIKIIDACHFNQEEVDALCAIDSPFIVRLYNYEKIGDFVYLTMEYCPKSMDSFIKSQGKMEEADLIKYAKEVLYLLSTCHKANISHGDLKPSNLLLDQFGRAKVGDFGLSSKNNSKTSTNFGGSFLYMAPEIFLKEPFDPYKADVWSFGVSLYVLYTGFPPWFGYTQDEILQAILAADYIPLSDSNPEINKVIDICLKRNPAERPTVDQLLRLGIFGFHTQSYVLKNDAKPQKIRSVQSYNMIKLVGSTVFKKKGSFGPTKRNILQKY
ncbi:CAMK family protein kinase [Trichomonas vaginalis G3]|uniref:CAMK family protein kinase n=1 Tax=Trichomonas vaginalis (strain ATCC PRA-98 / G3) TaxID=412133 RepID=A2FZR7_TRIV3|nr:protein serine/threonine kinase protein [Trichomonas vaginalis G3]EAX89607.1 CAMK family protein kinase [Trichomonas vaginalis G3]KAI5512110.1 protein serine/threonine kinase protein [Trichomonas vaginalis G3]|eukprot:XP_001302537.1 CAMK family protein kinase [Trichomonas vaginalis G3]